MLYGGLNHRIYLEEWPAVYIEHVQVDAREDKTATITVTVKNRVTAVAQPDFNGKEILLKGVNRYNEYAPYGNCAPEE